MELDYDFAFYLTLATFITGVIYLLDKLLWEKKRLAAASAEDEEAKEPWAIDFSKSFFPVLALVLVIRSFIAEPFRIPSGSMLPTLLVGDFLVVTKYSYGIRLPVINKKVIDLGEPERGDVIVFRYPVDPSLDYIKRVIGVPGDKIIYKDKRLHINDQEVFYAELAQEKYIDRRGFSFSAMQLEEDLLGVKHTMQIHTDGRDKDFDFTVVVPEGGYFVMGDNRDNSGDSRVWGFVPEENLVGKARFIWMHLGLDGLDRVGTLIK